MKESSSLPPQNETEQSTQLTLAQLWHLLACESTLFFFNISPHPSQEKDTIFIYFFRVGI